MLVMSGSGVDGHAAHPPLFLNASVLKRWGFKPATGLEAVFVKRPGKEGSKGVFHVCRLLIHFFLQRSRMRCALGDIILQEP